MTSNGSSGKFVHSRAALSGAARCESSSTVSQYVPRGISNEPMSVSTPLTAAERVEKRELRKQWLEHAESVDIVRAKTGKKPRQHSRRVPPSDKMGLDEPCSPSESVDVEPQQDAVQGDEAEQQQKDDSPAESDDEPDAPQPVRPRDARTGRFGLARDTMDPELLGSRYRVGA